MTSASAGSRVRRTADRGEITVLAARIATFGVGPLTVLAIGTFFTPTLQGYYFSFTSIIAGSQLFEAGIATAVIQIAAHEMGRLRSDGDSADSPALQRLAAVLRFSVRWYAGVAAAMVVGITAVGLVTLSGHHDGVGWLLPWLLLVVFAAVDLGLQGFFVVLEGAGHIEATYRYRLVRVVALNGVLIGAVALGAGLFGLGLGMAASSIVGAIAVLRSRAFFSPLLRIRAGRVISWRSEILPFQGRIAISWMAGYFSAACFTPLLLVTRGAAEAGRMGMTMMLTSACTSLAASFIQAKAPALGGLAGSGRWPDLLTLFKLKARRSILAAAGLLTGATAFIAAAQVTGIPLADRVLPWPVLAVLAVGALAYHVEGVFAFFMRAQKREPYFVLEVIGAVVILPTAALISTSTGVFGLCVLFAAVHVAVLLPIATGILVNDIRRVRRRSAAELARTIDRVPAMDNGVVGVLAPWGDEMATDR